MMAYFDGPEWDENDTEADGDIAEKDMGAEEEETDGGEDWG